MRYADEVFEAAGVTANADTRELYKEVDEILSTKMAFLSATMGLTYDRVRIFEQQKTALVRDLKKLKKAGTLR
jgi:hypothetical protein